MKVPEGYTIEHDDLTDDDYVMLVHSIYGLVQAARQWYKLFSHALACIGFKVCPVDPCLMYKNDENGICIVLIYVDDDLVVGTKKSIHDMYMKLQKWFKLKLEENTRDYLSCEIKISNDF